jgi:predicted Zn-dependent protease
MQNNPDSSFGLEESFPLKSTYPDAVPLGPIMQLGAQGNAGAFTADLAAQTVAYWQNSAQQLLANPEAAGSADTRLTYSHDAVAQANLLAAHDYPAEAEQAYNLASQLAPTNFEAVAGLSDVLYHTGQANQAIQILNDFAKKNPSQQAAVNLKQSFLSSK